MPNEVITKKLETATNKIGRAFGDLLGVFEKHGDEITGENLEKIFTFLNLSLGGIYQKALIARSVAVATNGGFTLDMELPTPPPAQHEMRVAGHGKRIPSPPPSLDPEDDDDVGFIED